MYLMWIVPITHFRHAFIQCCASFPLLRWEYLYAMAAAIKNMDLAVTWPREQHKNPRGHEYQTTVCPAITYSDMYQTVFQFSTLYLNDCLEIYYYFQTCWRMNTVVVISIYLVKPSASGVVITSYLVKPSAFGVVISSYMVKPAAFGGSYNNLPGEVLGFW